MQAINKFDQFESQRRPGRSGNRWIEAPARRPGRVGGKWNLIACVGGVLLLLATPARSVVISFADPQPVVLVNDPVRMTVTIDTGATDTEALFSYGISVVGDWDAQAILPLGVAVPAALDYNGVAGPGALIGLGDEFIGVKGTVNLSGNPIEMYAGNVLAEFQLRFTQPGSYELRLDFFNTLGPTEDIFVNQDGIAIDDQIEFRPGLVQVVIPEPRISTLLLAATASLLVRRTRILPAATQS